MCRLALVRTELPTELLAGEWGSPPPDAALRLDVPNQPSLEASLVPLRHHTQATPGTQQTGSRYCDHNHAMPVFLSKTSILSRGLCVPDQLQCTSQQAAEGPCILVPGEQLIPLIPL